MNFDNLHGILQNLYQDMIPLCSDMIGVAKGLAGLGALFYVAYRVKRQALSRAEPIDVFPLQSVYPIGLCIMFFPDHSIRNDQAVMSPVVECAYHYGKSDNRCSKYCNKKTSWNTMHELERVKHGWLIMKNGIRKWKILECRMPPKVSVCGANVHGMTLKNGFDN